MASRCTATNRVMTTVVAENYVETTARKSWSYKVKGVDGAISYKLNTRCDLPEGLKFEKNKISGKIKYEGVYHLDFIGLNGDGEAVGAIKVIVTAKTNDGSSGCGGDVASVGAIVGFIALAGAGLMLVSLRKKKRA